MRQILFSAALLLCCAFSALAQSSAWAPSQGQQEARAQRVQKRYNIFFRINSPEIDRTFQDNARTLDQMKHDIDTTLAHDGAVPDSLLILSTASPDGSYSFNKWLAGARAESTEQLLLEMFPEFKDATIIVNFLEEDWDGLRQVLRMHPEFPQREMMLSIIDAEEGVDDKEKALRACKEGWRYLTNNYIHALRNSSITLSVIGPPDEYTRATPVVPVREFSYEPEFKAPQKPIPPHRATRKIEWRKMILAGRTNLLAPGLNFGVEVPIADNWSIGLDYYYPWAVSKNNKWCSEMLGWFIDAKYWFPGEKYQWTRTERLQGHAVGIYGGIGYYDYQNRNKGNQGEYVDVGVDYTFALPIAQNRLRLEFNLGVGFIYTLYRPYHPSSDYEDLIKEPGIKYQTTNFFGPTRAGVSLVVPIIVKTKMPRIYKVEGGK